MQTQTPDQIKSRLFSLTTKGIKYDLDRMYKAVSLCGEPQKSYPSVHVAGTNGKGSTCTYIESVLRHAGYKTGLYTSPHIINFEERFKINGVDINESDWFEVYKDQEEIINDLGLTFFEAATLMAFEIFKRAGVEYAVFETGMGGRLDATNIIHPAVSVIAKIAMDHSEYLGNDIVTIAGEKLGIVKSGVPVVMLEPDDPQIKQLAADKCKSVKSDLSFVNISQANNISYQNDIISFEFLQKKYDISLYGTHQIQNALLALSALSKLNTDINYETIYNGMKSAIIPGRFQVVSIDNKKIIFEVAHNPDAATVLIDTLNKKFPDKKISFVVGMMGDKDISSTIRILSTRASKFYFAKPDIPRAADPKDLYGVTTEYFNGMTVIAKSVPSALSHAINNVCTDDVICVTGSFYTVSEAINSAIFS